MIVNLIKRHTPRSDLFILDVGCGTGQMILRLAEEGHRSLGIDIFVDDQLVSNPHPKMVCFSLGTATNLPLAAESFDLVLSLDVLEHVDDSIALDQIFRVLIPGGVGIFSVPAFPWLWSYRDEGAGHLRRYTKTGLVQNVKRVGFSIMEVKYYQFFLFPLVILTRLIGRKNEVWRDREERPTGILNRLLHMINDFEVRLSKLISFPWGSTLVVVCRKSD